MAHLSEIKDPKSVRKAVAEYDKLGQAAFLYKYKFGRAKSYFLRIGRKLYDSKAIVGAAYGYEHPKEGALSRHGFSGGEQTVARRLNRLGFVVVVRQPDGTEVPLDRLSARKLTAAVDKAAIRANEEGEFDPTDVQDARERITARIAKRQGQPQFRRKLLAVYGGRCAISGFDCTDALEAAHIHPYRGTETNHVTNGILLRSDLHTLFDLGLLGIDSIDYTVLVADQLKKTSYAKLAGQQLRLPANQASWPNLEVLDKHRATFGL